MKNALLGILIFACGCHAQGFRVASPLNVAATGSSATINGITSNSTTRGSIVFTSTGVTVVNSGNAGLKVFDTTGNVQVNDQTTDQGYKFYVNGNIYATGNVTCGGSCGAGGGAYATIQDEGTPLTQRTTLNFIGSGVTCADDAGNTRTNCTISGGGSSLPVVDSTAVVYKTGDATKTLNLSAASLTAARTLTVQDASYTAAGLEQNQTWTGTNTMRDVFPSVDDTYRLGTDTGPLRWYEIAGNRINGISSGGTAINNYVLTRWYKLYDQTGGTGAWGMLATAAGGTSQMVVQDSAGATKLTMQTSSLGSTTNLARWAMHVVPDTTNTWDVGSGSLRWANGYFTNINVSGTCTGCSSGANTALSNLSSVAINTALLPTSDNVLGIGDSAHEWAVIYGRILASDATISLAGTSVSAAGTTSGTVYPFRVVDSSTSPGITFYRSTSTKTAGWSAGATSAFSVQDDSDNFRFVVLQSGNVLINRTSDGSPAGKLQIDPGSGSTGLVIKGSTTTTAAIIQQTGTSAGTALSVVSAATGGFPAAAFESASRTIPVVNLVETAGGTTCQFFAGSGTPESAVSAGVCSVYLRSDGSTSTTLYIKTSGSGNTGWTAK